MRRSPTSFILTPVFGPPRKVIGFTVVRHFILKRNIATYRYLGGGGGTVKVYGRAASDSDGFGGSPFPLSPH